MTSRTAVRRRFLVFALALGAQLPQTSGTAALGQLTATAVAACLFWRRGAKVEARTDRTVALA